MKKMRVAHVLMALMMMIIFSAQAQAGQVRISVAASMTDLFKSLIATYTEQHAGVEIVPNFASSGALAKQIEQGAPAEVYVSANEKWMKYLLEKGKIDASTQKVFAYNSLVFTGQAGVKALSMSDLQNLTRIALGSPNSVPAGQYAKQAMDKLGIYDALLEKGKLVMAKDVRQALIYADRGETDGAFVYKTDAMLATKAKILFEVPQDLYDQVTYPVAITVTGASNDEAKAFYAFITSDAAHSFMLKYGFTLAK